MKINPGNRYLISFVIILLPKFFLAIFPRKWSSGTLPPTGDAKVPELSPSLVVETVTKLGINLTRIAPVEATERQAIVHFHAVVGHIERGYGNGVFFEKGFAERNINRGMPRQIDVIGIGCVRDQV